MAVHVQVGEALEAVGRVDDALAVYRAAAEANTADTIALHTLGRALLTLRRYDGAVAAFEAAVERAPEDGTLQDALADARRVRTEQAAIAERIKRYAAAVRLDPNSFYDQYELGLALAVGGQELRAVEAWTRALQLNPAAGAPYYQLALAAFRSGDYRTAQSHLDAARSRNFEPDPEFVEQLAAALRAP